MNDVVYEVGTAVEFRAFHVMPGMPPPEGERHSHDYRLDVVASREELDGRGMVVDLDVLERALQQLADLLDGADLDAVVGPHIDAEAVTGEAFSRWLDAELCERIGVIPDVTVAVRVWESPTAFGGYRSPMVSSR